MAMATGDDLWHSLEYIMMKILMGNYWQMMGGKFDDEQEERPNGISINYRLAM